MAAKQRHHFNLTLPVLIIALVIISGCCRETGRTEFLLGTVCRIRIWGGDESNIDAAFNRIREIEAIMSRHVRGSEIRRISHSDTGGTQISQNTCQVIRRALDFARLSGGLFDVTIAPVLDLWGFGTEEARIPLPDTLEAALTLVDYERIRVLDGCRVVTGPGQSIDLGGIAKGYAADQAAWVLKNAGVERALINLGGNIFALGNKKDGSPWNIGIQDPLQPGGSVVGTLKVSGGAVVTTGIYERFVEIKGKRYHHIIDPHTGYPVENNLAGISISAPSSLDADALSTVVFLLGLEKGCELLRSFPDVGAVFIAKNREIITFGKASSGFNLTNSDYTVKERR